MIPNGHDGGRHERANRHHGERLEEHARGGQCRIDALPLHQAGAQDNHHRLAGHILSEVTDIVGAKCLRQAHVLTECPQRSVPEDAGQQRAEQVQPARRRKPPEIALPATGSKLLPSVDQCAADEPDHDRDDQQFDRRENPSFSALGASLIHERIPFRTIVAGAGRLFK